jgi:hypothetical protein
VFRASEKPSSQITNSIGLALKHYRFVALLLFAVTVFACTGGNGTYTQEDGSSGVDTIEVDSSESLHKMVLEHQMTINQLNEPHIQNFWGIYVDDDGNIYWQDNRIAKLHQYSPSGEYLHSFGDVGKGPGEFRYLESSSISGDAIIMLDAFSQIVHVFNRHTGNLLQSGVLERENVRDKYSPVHRILAETDTTFIGIPQQSAFSKAGKESISLHRYATSGKILDYRLLTYRSGEALESESGGVYRRTPVSFTAKSEIFLIPGGGVIHSFAAEPMFNIYDSSGDITRSISLDFNPVKLTREHIDTVIQNSHPMIDLESAVREADHIPDRWPVWSEYFISGDGNLWVKMNTNPPHETEWWIISLDGVLLAKETFGELGSVHYANAENVYFSTFVEEIHQVHRYSLEMTAAGQR